MFLKVLSINSIKQTNLFLTIIDIQMKVNNLMYGNDSLNYFAEIVLRTFYDRTPLFQFVEVLHKLQLSSN